MLRHIWNGIKATACKVWDYIHPKSVTWWTGLTLITSGVLQIYDIAVPYVTELFQPAIQAFYPSMGPGQQIMMGLGFIGIRAAIARS